MSPSLLARVSGFELSASRALRQAEDNAALSALIRCLSTSVFAGPHRNPLQWCPFLDLFAGSFLGAISSEDTLAKAGDMEMPFEGQN